MYFHLCIRWIVSVEPEGNQRVWYQPFCISQDKGIAQPDDAFGADHGSVLEERSH